MVNVNVVIKAKFTPVDQATEPEKWMQLRTTGIGGSDVGAIMGLNKYASPLTVYLSKKDIEGFKGNAATEWGHILEDPIRKKASEELGISICTVPGMYTSNEYPFMNANLDGVCHADHQVTIGGETVEGIGGHEIKTSNSGDGFTSDEIPDSYYCQVQHYMAVTGLDWFILTVFFMNTKAGKHYVIRRNDDFIYTKMIPAEKDFWENYVLANVTPEPSGVDSESEYIQNLSIDSVIELDEATENLITEEKAIESQIKELNEKQSQLKNQILLNLSNLSTGFEDADKTTATGSNWKITYNKQIKKSIDTDAIKKAGLFDQYSKESSYKVMRISELKK